MTLETILATAGLPGLFLGTIAEGEAVALLGGVLAQGDLVPVEAVALVVWAGAMVADNLSFALGRWAGQGAFARRLLAKGPVPGLHRQLLRHEVIAVLGFRFLYGLKTAGAVLIGTTAIGWRRFALLDAIGCGVWAHLFVGLGYLTGGAVGRMLGDLAPHPGLILGVALVLGAAYALHRVLRRRG